MLHAAPLQVIIEVYLNLTWRLLEVYLKRSTELCVWYTDNYRKQVQKIQALSPHQV